MLRFLKFLPCLFLLFSFQLIHTPVAANTGLMVQGTRLVADVAPGDRLIHKISLNIGTDDPATYISVSVSDLELTPDGIAVPVDSEGTGLFSAAGYITLDKTLLYLEPGQPQSVLASVQVPEQATGGGKYALIAVKTRAAGGSGVGIVSAVNIPVYLTLKGSELTHTGEITGINIGDITDAKPLDIITTFANTGNHHFKVNNDISISGPGGIRVGKITTGLTSSSVIPGSSRNISARFAPAGGLDPGIYEVKSQVTLEDGTILDTATSRFEVKNTVLPPSSEPEIPTPSIESPYLTESDVLTADATPEIISGDSNNQPPPPDIEASNQTQINTFLMDTLQISPAKARPGQPVIISVPVTNVGPSENSLELTFNINGVIEEKKNMNLKSGESRTAYFVTGKTEPGSYTVDISGMAGDFQVSSETSRDWKWWAGGGAVLLLGASFFIIRSRRRRHA